MGYTIYYVVMALLIIVITILMLVSAVRIIQPYEEGLLIILGRYTRKLPPGFNMVPPLISSVVKIDLREQVLEVSGKEYITRDNSKMSIELIVSIRVVDTEKAFLKIANYKMGITSAAQTFLWSMIGSMTAKEALEKRIEIFSKLKDILIASISEWGVQLENIELKRFERQWK